MNNTRKPKRRKKSSKELHDIESFSGNKVKALQRDNYKCILCGSLHLICVHHKDKKGKGYKKHERNDSLENLETLCHKCHRAEHRIYDKVCTENDCNNIHFSRGMCRPHYMKWYKGDQLRSE